MPSWQHVLQEIHGESQSAPVDRVRRKYLAALAEKTGRNTIAYYSGWLQHRVEGVEISDLDMNGFMSAVHGLDRTKGLDLLLHTPGGQIAAAEAIVGYLRRMFGTDIRAIIPQVAMSAGTMIACSCKTIVMGKQSSLGPIDPQFGMISARGVLDEFQKALTECQTNPSTIPIWQIIVSKYTPTFIDKCKNACARSEQVVQQWLVTNMLKDNPQATEMAALIVRQLLDAGHRIGHDLHIDKDGARAAGLTIEDLEDDQEFQDLVLTIHHAFMHTIAAAPCVKITENHMGSAIVNFFKPS
ncbi:MAG: SDH family Clp fold serine proteinase [Thermodesulfobacteriota bacterium]